MDIGMKQLAVISDIHGNYKALEAFLEDIKDEAIDGIICLGDYVTDAPFPQRTLDLLYGMMKRYTCYMVRGNREQYLIDNFHRPMGWRPSSANGALYYTAENLTPQDIGFFESLPIAAEVKTEGLPALTICHGTPEEIRGNVREDPGIKEDCMQKLRTPYLLGGHSHHQETDSLCGRTYINPGSLGLAIDGIGRRAQYALLQGGREEIRAELKSIPYDVDAYLQDFTASGLDGYGMILNRAVKKTLVTGINYFYEAVVEAYTISGVVMKDVPETVWEQVARKLEL